MNAIVVRNPDGSIRHMGPENGMYDPGVPVGCTKAVEADYDALITTHLAELRASRGPTWQERVDAAQNVADVKSLLREIRS